MTIFYNDCNNICEECLNCQYFEHEYWNCTGEDSPCFEYIPIEKEEKRLTSN